ncbi:MAG: GNAT family N-acetyltransferase [Burkholderiaceae bacterium]
MLERFTNVDHVHEVAFAAAFAEATHERIVGFSRYSLDPSGHACECAVRVSDEWHQQGLGSLLMKYLIEVARAGGIRSMYSIDDADNVPMHALARFLGFNTRVDPDDTR